MHAGNIVISQTQKRQTNGTKAIQKHLDLPNTNQKTQTRKPQCKAEKGHFWFGCELLFKHLFWRIIASSAAKMQPMPANYLYCIEPF